MDYFDRAFPSRVLSGGLSILFLVGLVIALTMIAKTFGAYAGRLALGDNSSPLVVDLFASGVVIAVVMMNMAGSGLVRPVEGGVGGVKLVLLTVLVLAGMWALH